MDESSQGTGESLSQLHRFYIFAHFSIALEIYYGVLRLLVLYFLQRTPVGDGWVLVEGTVSSRRNFTIFAH